MRPESPDGERHDDRDCWQPDEPRPVRSCAKAATSDFVLTADHAGRAIPRRLGDLSAYPRPNLNGTSPGTSASPA